MSSKVITNLSKGLLRKTNKLKQDSEYYPFALNITPSENISDRHTKVTENKLELDLTLNDTDYVILGYVWFGKNEYVYFIKNKTTSKSEIWHVNNSTKTLKYNDDDLNFKFDKLISSTYRVDYKGDRLVYFVDGYNNDRVINIDKVKLTDNIVSLDLIAYYGTSNTVDLSVQIGGKLLQGNYIVAAAFNDANNSETNIKVISNYVSVGDGDYLENRYSIYNDDNASYFNSNNTSFLDVKGLRSDNQSNKSIKLKLRNEVISDYQSMNIYVIRITETSTEVKLLENLRVSNELIITGAEYSTTVAGDIASVIISNIPYNKSEAVHQKDNRLIRANTKIDSVDYNFQEIANNIIVKYNTEKVVSNRGTTNDLVNRKKGSSKYINDFSSTTLLQSSSPDYLSNNNNKLNKTFSRDEVYALGVYFELDNGVVTDVYHIPGRLPNPLINGTWESTGISGHYGNTYDINFDTKILGSKPRWKIYNTAIKTSSNEGYLGYYHCNEVYPDGYGYPTNGLKDSSGKSYIRHHKIPSDILEPIISTVTNRFGDSSNFTIDNSYIGLKFEINIPNELSSRIKKVNYTFSPKTNNNKNVISKGISYAVDGIRNRQSDQLNRFADSLLNTNKYEYYSAESLFKFKQSNISAKRVKPTAVYNGVVRYICKLLNKLPPSESVYPHYPAWLNSEGANLKGFGEGQSVESYNYKQVVKFDNIYYNNRIPLVSSDIENFEIETIKFIDANSVVSSQLDTLNFSGNQDTVFFKIKDFDTSPYFKLDFSNPAYNFQNNRTSHLMVNYPSTWDTQAYNWQTSINRELYHDSVVYATLLSDNENIDSNIINLKYVNSYMKNNVLIGDCNIDVLHGKRGFSEIFSSAVEIYGRKSGAEYIEGVIDGNNYRPAYDNYTDSSMYEDYFSFFTETQLNIRMRSGDTENTYYPDFTLPANQLANIYEKQAGKKEYYYINDGYNQYSIDDKNSNNVKVEDLYIDQRRLDTRIIYSEVQNHESRVDNYRRTLANNYRDLITTKGSVYQLFTKQEKLYAITRDSIFLINTSNQVLKTDSDYNITVGTGSFFGIEPNELISIEGGFGGTSSKLSLNENPYGYLYVDKIKNKVILFNDNLLDINDIGLLEDFNLELIKNIPDFVDLDNPQLGYGVSTGYDPKLKRLLITKLDYKPLDSFLNRYKGLFDSNSSYSYSDFYIKDGLFMQHNGDIVNLNDSNLFENKSFTASFDPINQSWISYHTYLPNRYVPNSNELKLVNSDIDKFGSNYSDIQIIEVVLNESTNITNVFDSIEVDLRSEDVDGNPTNDFFTELIAYNEKQSTGLLSLDKSNLTKKETYWNINSLRDDTIDYSSKKLFVSDWNNIKNNFYIDKVVNPESISLNKPWYKKGRFRDKYLVVRFIRKNLDNKKIFCNFVISNVRASIR